MHYQNPLAVQAKFEELQKSLGAVPDRMAALESRLEPIEAKLDRLIALIEESDGSDPSPAPGPPRGTKKG